MGLHPYVLLARAIRLSLAAAAYVMLVVWLVKWALRGGVQ